MKRPNRTKRTIITFLTSVLTAAAILLWLRLQNPPASPSLSASLPAASLPANSVRKTPSNPSELRGRRGIIREIADDRIEIETTDSYAQPNERVIVIVQPLTSFVLITIPKHPQQDRETVIRIPSQFNELALGNDVFAISFRNIIASSTFSALRIEKIVTP